MTEKLDRFGAVASSLCAVHCAVCAFLPAALGALGLGFLIGHEAEWILSLIAISFAAIAAVVGYRQHGSKATIGLLAVGIVGLLASRGIEAQSGHHDDHAEPHHEDAHHSATSDHNDAKTKEQHAKASQAGDGKEAHHAEGYSRDHHAEGVKGSGHSDEHHGDDSEHDDATHLIGAGTGILAGFFLLLGHIFNIRASRKFRDDGCV